MLFFNNENVKSICHGLMVNIQPADLMVSNIWEQKAAHTFAVDTSHKRKLKNKKEINIENPG